LAGDRKTGGGATSERIVVGMPTDSIDPQCQNYVMLKMAWQDFSRLPE
jgi:hypothetical protein